MESVGFHLLMIDNVNAEVKQLFRVFCRIGNQAADSQFQTVQVVLCDVACGIDQVLEELVLFDGLEHVFIHLKMTCSAFVELDIVHMDMPLEIEIGRLQYRYR